MTKINNIKQLSNNAKIAGKGADMNLNDALNKTVETIKDRIEKEIPDVGYFRDFAEDFANSDDKVFARAISIAVQRDTKNEGKAFLSLNILHPSMVLNASTELAYGDRKQLLEVLNGKDFAQKLQNSLHNLSEKMRNYE